MSLSADTRLGPYEILSALGAGGMGEVYKARDTRLDRLVAIKILPERLAADPQFRERFAREARTISQLDHPNICALYDVGEHNGTAYLVMQYLEGETLEDRLNKGAVSIEQAFRYAIEIADALSAAHRAGITHRDLKPGNVMLTKAGAKLLDFGLAKTGPLAGAGTALSMLSTTPPALTVEGAILGTFQYMAPEQIEGRDADARSDLFAFGAVLHEMLTGRKAFEENSQAGLIGAILHVDPPYPSTFQPSVSPTLDHIVIRCLAKDPDKRWQNAQDLASELRWLTESRSDPLSTAAVASPRKHWIPTAAGILGLSAGVLIGVALSNSSRQSAAVPAAVTRSIVALPVGLTLGSGVTDRSVALSPDGSRIAFVAIRDNVRQLYLRALDEFDSTPLPGTEFDAGTGQEGAGDPFFSPDGRWIGFFAGGKLKKVAVSGGAVETICDSLGSYATWGPDDTIIFSHNTAAGLSSVPAAGGMPRVVTTLDETTHEKSHRFPQFLPGGKAVLFTIVSTDVTSYEEARIAVLSLDTGRRRVLLEGGSNPKFVSTGHVIYNRGAALYAVPFDPRRLEITGQPAPVMDGVHASAEFGYADYSIATNGTLAYIPGGVRESDRSVVWADRQGKTEPLLDARRPFQGVRLSPDGQRLALTVGGANDQVWLYDLGRRALTRLTFASDNFVGAWLPNGRQIAFRSHRTGQAHFYVMNVDGSGEAQQLTDGSSQQYAGSWSADGKVFVFDECCRRGWDIGQVAFQSAGGIRPLIDTRFDETGPQLSPDGHWVAYLSNESGRLEVYVQPFPALGAKWQISTNGASRSMPVWQRDGRDLFYQDGGKLMAVAVQTQPTFTAGTPRLVFEGSHVAGVDCAYDVAPDGRFIMIQTGQNEAPLTRIAVVQNWTEELRQRVPTK